MTRNKIVLNGELVDVRISPRALIGNRGLRPHTALNRNDLLGNPLMIILRLCLAYSIEPTIQQRHENNPDGSTSHYITITFVELNLNVTRSSINYELAWRRVTCALFNRYCELIWKMTAEE